MTWNPYYDEWQAEADKEHKRRHALVEKYAWAVPGPEVLEEIRRLSLDQDRAVVDVMAGTGYWAEVLGRMGVTVHAYDIAPVGRVYNEFFSEVKSRPWLEVKQAAAANAARWRADAVMLLVWPPHGEPAAARAVAAYHAAGGDTIVYVGEGYSGCTGDDEMHRMLGDTYDYCQRHDGEDETAACVCAEPPLFREVRTLSVPQWDGMRDYATVYERI